jgi:NADPH-dependent ferric siderophore reductase
MLTLPEASVLERDDRAPYRPFRVTVSALRELSPHFLRVTFSGPELEFFGTDRLDQRVKVVLPLETLGYSTMSMDAEWYTHWRTLPDHERNVFRTYTVRDVRPELGELDIDFVAHGDGGPASRWLLGATVGDEIVIVGPDARSLNSHVGIDWRPGTATSVLLVGDETAAPAICAILESLDLSVTAQAFIEVPSASDFLAVDTHATVTWLARGAESGLEAAVRSWAAANPFAFASALASQGQELEEIDVDVDLLWDSPGEATVEFYAWLAGESAIIKSLRRFLVTETGIDRTRVAFMGYWRLGKAEAQ